MWQEIITWFPTRADLSSSAVYQRGTVNCHEGRVDRDSDRDSIRLTGWDRSTLGKRCTLLHCTTSPSYSPSSVDRHLVYDALDLFLYILVHISMFCQSLYTFVFCLGFVSVTVSYFILGHPAHTRVPVHSIHICNNCLYILVFLNCHPGVLVAVAAPDSFNVPRVSLPSSTSPAIVYNNTLV